MTSAEIKRLPLEQKVQIMEALWEDFRERFEQSTAICAEQQALLDERRKRVAAGECALLEWETARHAIGRK